MFGEVFAVLKLIKIIKKIDKGLPIPKKLRSWYEKQLKQFRDYLGPVTCPKCKESYEVPNEVVRRCFRAAFKALTKGGKKKKQ